MASVAPGFQRKASQKQQHAFSQALVSALAHAQLIPQDCLQPKCCNLGF